MTEYKNVLNTETGELSQVPLTDDEIAEIASVKAKLEAERTMAEQAKAQKQALLDRLGISEEEAKLLLS